jgi:hypothetical protein
MFGDGSIPIWEWVGVTDFRWIFDDWKVFGMSHGEQGKESPFVSKPYFCVLATISWIEFS